MVNHIEKLLYLRGVSAEYYNYSGEHTPVAQATRLKLLAAVGYDVADDQAIGQAIFELDALPWKSWLKPFNVLCLGGDESIAVRVHPDELYQSFDWQVTTSLGAVLGGQFMPSDLPEVGEYYLEGVRYTAHRLGLAELPVGYHEFTVSCRQQQAVAVLAVAPERCFEYHDSDQQSFARLLGINCQLYTLRSQRNWGLGDFSDLGELVERSAAQGMDLIALNPLHAPDMAGADVASPYSPSDRRFLNPLYIDPEQVAEFRDTPLALRRYSSADFQEKLALLRAESMVDYAGVAAVKYEIFELLFQSFLVSHLQLNSDRARDFLRFVQQRGHSLEAFIQHESAQGSVLAPSGGDPRFHQYLQWVANTQLQQCQALAVKCGMKVGLMRDLAVGAMKGGAEVDGKPGLFCTQATIGAPPDPFADEGQNWNLPALDPIALRQDNYDHFIEVLRTNMSSCGALRIDHVMGLLRLWWCLADDADGAYVYYPLEDLLAIVRIESHAQQCLVVGEDMGVVPAELRARMTATAVYSNKLFYFERTADQQFKQPQDQQVDALLMVTNHDVSTLAGWWNGADLKLRCDCGLLDADQDLPGLLEQRQHDKLCLLAWLQSLQLLPTGWIGSIDELDKPFDIALCRAILAGNARSQSRIVLFQLDDLQLLEEPVNIPGTYREYPNWRRKQRLDTSTLFQDPQIQSLMASTKRERQG